MENSKKVKKWFGISLFFLVISNTSCYYFSSNRLDKPDEKVEELFWPLPPDDPRIKFIRTISNEDNVEKKIKKTFLIKFFEIITGAIFGRESGSAKIIRPYGISEYDDIVYVADQKLSVVHLFDYKAKKYHQIGMTNIGPLISPIDVAADDDGNFYVSDSFRKRIFVYNIDRINIMEIGNDNIFMRPTGIAINSEEKLLYVVDTLANKIRVFDLEGNFRFEFGKRGKKKGSELNFPTNIFLDREGNIYVSDSMNFKVKKFDKNGKFISMFGKIGDKLGYFARPKGVAVDSEGHIYVVESLFDRVQIFDQKGRLLLSFGRSGNQNGEFWLPSGIHIDKKDRIYVADAYNSRIQVFQYIKRQKKKN